MISVLGEETKSDRGVSGKHGPHGPRQEKKMKRNFVIKVEKAGKPGRCRAESGVSSMKLVVHEGGGAGGGDE